MANSGGNASILIGNADGTFQAASHYVAGSGPRSVAVGDFNADGAPDLAVANFGSNNVSILQGNGNGTFQRAIHFAAMANPQSVVLGDFNADGVSDLVTANEGGDDISVLVNTMPGPAVITQQPIPQAVGSGGTAMFGVVAAGVSPTYQWRRNAVPMADDARVTGSTTATLWITNATWSDQGSYDCIVSNACGGEISTAATLSVTECSPAWASLGDAPSGARWVHAQAWSGVNQGTLVFGGRDAASVLLGDTWLMAGGAWTEAATSGPVARTDHAMASLPDGRVLLFGGKSSVSGTASALGDTWIWDGTAWSLVSSSGPAPRFGHAMALDSSRGTVMMFGGLDASGNLLSDTWEWSGSAWVQVASTGPAGRFAHAMAFDPVLGETLVIGGYDAARRDDTWVWNGTGWAQAATGGFSARYYTAAAFDPQRGRVMMFGGSAATGQLNDSYEWDGVAWQPVSVGVSPTVRWTHAMSYDASVQGMVVTGGAGVGAVRLGDAWRQSGRPMLLGQPQSVTLIPGATAQMSVSAIPQNAGFQWRKGGSPVADGGRVSGATSAMLSITGVLNSDQGFYDCVVSNGCGDPVISNTAELSCKAVVTEQPSGGTYLGGQLIVLSPVYTTGGTTTFRWQKDGVNLFNGVIYSGVLTSTLFINADEPSQSGAYRLVITNPCGVTTTIPADIEVRCPADVDGDGDVDSDDVIEFFQGWDEGEGDYDGDGDTDSDDIIRYFSRWENGC